MEEKLNPAAQEPEEKETPEITEEEPVPYVPRPWWQVWGARILAAIFIIFVIMYYINIARGGL